MLKITGLSVEYKEGFKALNDIDVNIDDGQCVGLIGANGAGKSSLFKAITGLISYDGKVEFDGSSDLASVRKAVGYVIQESDDQMFMPTVIEDMIFGPVNCGMSKAEAMEKASEVLDSLGILDLKDRHNHKISGGEKKMAAIAVILAMDPKVILFDEPTSSLDPKNRRKVINILKQMKCTRIIASHDMDLIMDTCDRVILINKGRVVADGDASVILRDKKLLEDNDLELPLSLQGAD